MIIKRITILLIGVDMISRGAVFGTSAVFGVVLVALAFVFLSPDAVHATRQIEFDFQENQVAGQITLPQNYDGEPIDCIVFVHGDGAMDRGAFGYFDPYFSTFAQQGWCTLSWDKPGVEASEGDWLSFSMADRAALVDAGIEALRSQSGVNVDQIGVLGFSQAGWVMPKIDVAAHKVEFMVFVSPAINWMAQSNYMTQLRRSFAPDSEAKIAAEAQLDALIENGGSYQDYVRLSESVEFFDADDFTEQWWDFAVRNAGADMTQDLAALPAMPILLLAGGRDGQVDAQNSVETFERLVPEDHLRVVWFDEAGHSMLPVDERKPMSGNDGLWLLGKVMLWGSEAFVDGYWAALNGFIAAQFEQ